METPDRRRWAVLATGMAAMTVVCVFQFGLPYLIPALRDEGLTLAQAGLLTATPTVGLLATLVAWGAAADRWGERVVLTAGLGATGVILLVAAPVRGAAGLAACFLLAGATGAAVNASSGRLIFGWFAARERGLAMGLRQASLPLGVALAALVMPTLGRGVALVVLGVSCLVAAVLVVIVVRDPAAPPATTAKTGNPYRAPILWRIHAASALLVVPQVTVGTFALVFLVDVHGWAPSAAGRVLAIGLAAGAGARLAAGWWSDRAGTRLRPVRRIALVLAAVLALLAAGAGSGVGVGALLAAGVLTVSPNGLAYTAVAEHAGRGWAGRALGVQNTAQNLAAIATAPAMAAMIAATSYAAAFSTAVAFPLLAAALAPVRGEGLAGVPP